MALNAQQFEKRPWGTFEVLHEFKLNHTEEAVVKKITVLPGKRLSYQSHKLRREHWLVVVGNGLVIINGKDMEVRSESKVEVKLGDKHRIANTGSVDLIFIEISLGQFDEFDNTRYEDDYGRV